MDIKVEGAQKLDAVGRKLKEIGDKELKNNLTRGLRKAASPLLPAVRASALATLPKSGGLNELVAGSRLSVSNRLTGDKVGVRITARLPGHQPNSINRGRLRHPVFGNREVWVTQRVHPGWFSRPLEAAAPAVRSAVIGVIEETARSFHG